MLFDDINLDERYDYTLIQCKKSKKPINILSTAFNRTFEPSIDSLWKFKFEIPKYISDPLTKQQIENPEYDSIQTENLILLKVGEPTNPISQSYYIIKNLSESTDSLKMSVDCVSREQTLNKDMITIDGIERELVNNVDNNGIFNLIEQQTTWKLGYIDPNCLKDNINGGLVPRVRWISALSKPILQFLNDDIATAYNLIIMYDTYNKLINVYDKDDFGTHTGILLSEENYIKNLNKSTKSESVCTCLEVSGKDITINALTLDGSNRVYNYDFYMQNGQMSSELVIALSNYNDLLVKKDAEFKILKTQLDGVNATLVIKNSELSALEELQKALDRIQAGYMTIVPPDNVSLPVATTNCNNNRIAIENKKAEIAVLNTQVDALNVQISKIATDINKKIAKIIDTDILIFNDDLLEELEDFTLIENFSNEVYVTPEQLKKASEDLLKVYSVPTLEFSLDLVDFFKISQAQHIWNKIKLGDLVRVYSSKIKTNIDVRIIGYSYNIDTNSLNITFSNKDKKLDNAKLIGSKIEKSLTASKYLNTKRLEWNSFAGTKDSVEKYLANALDCSAQDIIALSGKNKINITENGIFCVEKDNENNGVYIGAGLICITDDGFQTVKTAVDKNGVFASVIVGKLLLGENLYIENESGNFKVDKDGVVITNSNNIDLSTNTAFNLKVGEGDVKSIIKASPEEVKFGFNGIDDNIVMSNLGIDVNQGHLKLKNGNNVVVIDGTSNILKISTEGILTMDITNADVEKTITLNHNLGYKPVINTYQLGANGTEEYTNLPAITWSNGVVGIIRARYDSNNVYIDWKKSSGYTTASLTIYIKYIIFKETCF